MGGCPTGAHNLNPTKLQVKGWRCPVCAQPLHQMDLVEDRYFADILQRTPPDVKWVTILPDGTWTPRPEEDHRDVIDLDDSDD